MISLRRARLDDYWRRSYHRSYPIKLNEIVFENGKIFNGLKINLPSGINAIVGKNGTGKSNFIRAIFNSFSSENSNRKPFNQLIDSSDVSFIVEVDGNSCSFKSSPSQSNENNTNILCLLFDPCNLIPEVQKLFYGQDNVDELLESFNTITLNNDDLKLVKFLTNTNYEKVEVINIEDEYDSFPMLPFFTVELGGIRYDSKSMGLGELSLLYFFWLVDNIKKSESPCLLLIEEPESFLPPLIQNRFCDVIAMIASMNGASCLLSTHSEHILKRIPRTHIHIMQKSNGDVRFYSASSNFEQMNVLGLNSPKKGILLYEDKGAYLLIKELVKASSLFVVDSFFYHKSGSEGDIVKDLERFPADLPEFAVVGIFDGDCRGKLDSQISKYNNYIYLPSNIPPEQLILDYLTSTDLSLVSTHLRTSNAALSAALDVAAGSDHHDFFYDLSSSLYMDFEVLFALLCDLWINDSKNHALVKTFISELEGKIG